MAVWAWRERESSSGYLLDSWPKGSRAQQNMGRGRRLFLSIWQLTQGYLKKRERTSLHTSDVFPSFYSDVDIKDKNGSARRGRQEHNKRHLASLLNWAGSSWSKAEKHQPDSPRVWQRVRLVAEPMWLVCCRPAWEHPASMDQAADGQRDFTAPRKRDEQREWAGQLGGRIIWSL